MIDVKELMVGNWVRVVEINGEPRNEIIQIKSGGMSAVYAGLMKVEPIALTEAILDANGLYNDGKDNYHFRVKPAGTVRHDWVEKILNESGLCDSVHEFQNMLRGFKMDSIVDNFKIERNARNKN